MLITAFLLFAVGILAHAFCIRRAKRVNRATPPYSLKDEKIVEQFGKRETRWIMAAWAGGALWVTAIALIVYHFA